jgi:tyrosine-protein phosphatase non-receptor type 23
MSPNLPADSGSSINERTKAHLALCTERKNEGQRENDLIYNAVLPVAEALPPIDKATVATPIPIQEVYSAHDVQKVIGPDVFKRLIPLSVHESASVYSEEKAKMVRGEVESAEAAEGEVRSALDSLGVKEGLARFKAIAEGEVAGQEVPIDVRRWKEDIALLEEREGVEGLITDLNRLKEGVRNELQGASRDLEVESKNCEMMRVKYAHLWTQEPSASHTKSLRQDLKAHFGSLDAAAASDQQVATLWASVSGDIKLLLSPEIEDVFRVSTERGGSAADLLDLDAGSEMEDAKERSKIKDYVDEIEERLGRLSKISRERNEVLKDLKEKVNGNMSSFLPHSHTPRFKATMYHTSYF